MQKPPHLATAMTPFPYSIKQDTRLTDALALMEEHNVRHLPVTEGYTVVGILTERDIRLAYHEKPDRDKELMVRDLSVDAPYIVSLAEPLDSVLLYMAENHVDSAIITKGGKLVGMFTTVDACRCFGEYLQDHFPHSGDDQVA